MGGSWRGVVDWRWGFLLNDENLACLKSDETDSFEKKR